MTKIAVSIAWGLVMGTAFTLGMFGIDLMMGHALAAREIAFTGLANFFGAAITYHIFYHSK